MHDKIDDNIIVSNVVIISEEAPRSVGLQTLVVYRINASCTVAIVMYDVYNVDVHKVNIGGRAIGEMTNRLSKRKVRNRVPFYIEM